MAVSHAQEWKTEYKSEENGFVKLLGIIVTRAGKVAQCVKPTFETQNPRKETRCSCAGLKPSAPQWGEEAETGNVLEAHGPAPGQCLSPVRWNGGLTPTVGLRHPHVHRDISTYVHVLVHTQRML